MNSILIKCMFVCIINLYNHKNRFAFLRTSRYGLNFKSHQLKIVIGEFSSENSRG